MKGIYSLSKALIFLFGFTTTGFSQYSAGNGSNPENDSIRCMMDISSYREFYKKNRYDYAHGPWLIAFDNCPRYSERIFVDGVNMYRQFIESDPEGPVKENRIDTLMLIYDRRMEYFGGEGNILGRKAQDLLTYRGDDIGQVHEAYKMLKRSIELEGDDSREPVLVLLISAGTNLKREGIIEADQLISDYLMVRETVDQLNTSSSRKERTLNSITEIVLKGGDLSCASLNEFYEPIFEKNRDSRFFIENVISLYTLLGCDQADIYTAAAESLYSMEPGPESAHNLAILFITRNEFDKAALYLKEAIAEEDVSDETLAEWYYELAVVSTALKNYCEAIEHARKVVELDETKGKAYILLGDAYIASRDRLGSDFEKRTAFWAASDMYIKARSADPELAEEANQKLADSAAQYPDQEEVFFRDLNEGDPYTVGGCIDQVTTVRSRK